MLLIISLCMWDHLGINCDFLLVFCADDTGLVCLLLVAFVSSPNDHPFIPHPFNSHGASMTCTFNNVSLSSSVCHVIHPISEREADTHNSQVVNTWTSSEVHNRKEDKVVLRAEMEDGCISIRTHTGQRKPCVDYPIKYINMDKNIHILFCESVFCSLTYITGRHKHKQSQMLMGTVLVQC